MNAENAENGCIIIAGFGQWTMDAGGWSWVMTVRAPSNGQRLGHRPQKRRLGPETMHAYGHLSELWPVGASLLWLTLVRGGRATYGSNNVCMSGWVGRGMRPSSGTAPGWAQGPRRVWSGRACAQASGAHASIYLTLGPSRLTSYIAGKSATTCLHCCCCNTGLPWRRYR